MALISSSSRSWRYNVFLSFHGPDVRVTFLSHLRKQFERNGIITFNDQEIERSKTIKPALTWAIQESRISILVLSQNYASSSWCLNELVDILKCGETAGQTVMTVFYKVDPSDVRKQMGDFGKAFKKTCIGKTEMEIQSWTQALTHVANIEGEHSLNWVNEADMIAKIGRDVSNKLNATPSRDFDGMVGLESHLEIMKSFLHFENDGAMIVGICGPAGIGKTTIAKALYNQLSCGFPLRYFMENVRGSYRSFQCDDHGLKLHLQEQLLSKIMDQNGMKICHLNVIKERLCNQKVLIILDDVDHLEQLDALAGDIYWFGPGSRIIVTTEDQELLQQHGINNTYHVEFPSNEEALAIFCLSTFKQIFPPDGFGKFAKRAVELCSNLPLGLRVVGSSLRGKEEDEWEVVLQRLETSIDRDIERILRVGYENLHEKNQSLFLYIAIFFNYTNTDHLKAMLADMDERHGLKTLVDKSLIKISNIGVIMMHKLLQQIGTQAIHRQEPWKRHILIDAHDICDLLECDKGTRTMTGISFDISEVSEVFISKGAFKRMRNLQFISIDTKSFSIDDRVHIPEEMEFPPRLRLLHWKAYPRKNLPSSFNPQYLVELKMQTNNLEMLWEGTQLLTNLKKLDLSWSIKLKELPDLSNATRLETLDLSACGMVEIPSSFSNLHKLETLTMVGCTNLEVIPADMNLASIRSINMIACFRLRSIPLKSTNITKRYGSDTEVEEEGLWSLKTSTQVTRRSLYLNDCRKLESLPEISNEFMFVNTDGCESLRSVPCCLYPTYMQLNFSNCFKLSQEARRSIIQRSFHGRRDFVNGYACLPGREVPTEFNHRAKGNCLTIRSQGNKPLYAFATFKVCLVLSPNREPRECTIPEIMCRRISKDGLYSIDDTQFYNSRETYPTLAGLSTEHLFVFLSDLDQEDKSPDVCSEIMFEFSCASPYVEIVECGAQIWTQETGRSKKGAKRTNFRSCIILCFIFATVVLILCFNPSSL